MQSDPSAHHLGSGSGHNVHPGSSGRTGDHHDTHGTAHHSDNSPFPPASPNLSTAFHRPQHTGNEQELSSVPQLRTRITQLSKGDTIRIAIATPLSDRDRRKERDISAGSTIAQVKDIIAGDEEESWERSSMRLIWNGRVLRDEEVLRDFLITRDVGQVHTLHLVARSTGSPSRPPLSRAMTGPVPAPEPPVIAAQTPQTSPSINRNTQALSDTVHFVLFLIRHHLCHLLSIEVLAWDDVYPKPVMDQSTAKTAVMSVIRGFASLDEDRNEAWSGWEKGFEEENTFADWNDANRAEMESEAKSLWSERLGRQWSESPLGEQVQVELDGTIQQLHLPPLHLMSPKQLIHLVLYLRLTSLLPMLNHLLAVAQLPTPTRPGDEPPLVRQNTPRVRTRIYGLRMRLTADSLWNVTFSAIKVGAMLWMLTRDMKWSDVKLWIIGGGLLGWWLGDALNQLRPHVIWNNGRPNQPIQPNAPAVDTQAAPGQAAGPVPANGQAPIPSANTAPRQPPQAGTLLNRMVPLIHLDADSEQLLLARRHPTSQPYRLVTQLLLPIALWLITLIPDWEALRARAIRRRERAMRVWVGELTEAAQPPTEEIPIGEAPEGEPPARPPVFPDGLGPTAKKYYERVMARGEGIDWEEEREAQRAMGIADEDEAGAGQDDGMRMRML